MLLELKKSPALPADATLRLKSGPVMIVNLAAIQRNFRRLSEMTQGICAAIVKGDAYGHGMAASSRALLASGATLFFTARLDDAVELREVLGPGPKIAVLDGVASTGIQDALANDIMPVVNSPEQLAVASNAARSAGRRLAAFVHLDTAMNRLGLAPEEDVPALPFLTDLDVQAYMTHFASADDVDLELCRAQVRRLRERAAMLPPAPLSIANSCGVFLGPEFHGDIIRPGKSTFGINPLPKGENPLEEPATVLAPVVQLRSLSKGDPVGYSCTWHAPGARRVAILAIGYANGFMRCSSNVGSVSFDGRLAPIVGRVSMDLTAVDVTDLPEGLVSVGTTAEIVGDHISYRSLAGSFGTNEHEAIISLGRGCYRTHTGGPAGG